MSLSVVGFGAYCLGVKKNLPVHRQVSTVEAYHASLVGWLGKRYVTWEWTDSEQKKHIYTIRRRLVIPSRKASP